MCLSCKGETGSLSSQGSGRWAPEVLQIISDSFFVPKQEEKVALEVHEDESKKGLKKSTLGSAPSFFDQKV